MELSSIVQVLSVLTAVASLSSAWVWHKSSKSKEAIEKIYETIENKDTTIRRIIDKATNECARELSHLEVKLGSVRDENLKEFSKVWSAIGEHRVEKISKADAKDLIDSRLEPVWETLKDLKSSIHQMAVDQKELLQGISRIEGSIIERRKRDD